MDKKSLLEEREFELAYSIEKCLDMKLDSAEFRSVREACRDILQSISFHSYTQGWNTAIAQINTEVLAKGKK